MNGVSVGIGDVSENPSDELHGVEDLGRASVVSRFGLVSFDREPSNWRNVRRVVVEMSREFSPKLGKQR